jgi:hypothetical protein
MSIALPIQTISFEKPKSRLLRLLSFVTHPKLDTLDRTILLFAILAPFTNIPQLMKIFTEQHADLSLTSWSLYALFNIPLLSHGLIRKDKVVLFNTSLNMVMQICIVIGILLYR